MRLKAKRSASGSNHRSRARRGVLSLALAATALIALAFAASAQAVTYEPGTELITVQQTSSVAVDQSSGDVYAGSVVGASAPFALYNGEEGGVKLFNSAGAEQSCALSPAPFHPDGLAVDPESGELHVLNITQNTAASEARVYPAGCGAELPATTGTADTHGSTELTNVSTTHELLAGQAIEGEGIPVASGTAEATAYSKTLKNVSGVSGNLVVGQRVTGSGISGNATIAKCFESEAEVPSCPASTDEIELSAISWATGSVTFTARTTVAKVEGSEVELSNAAEESKTGAEIEGMAWQSTIQQTSFPTPQPAVDSSGNLLIPSYQNNALGKFSPWGAEAVEGGFPVSADRPAGAALDAAGNVYVTNSGASTSFSCANTANGRLTKLNAEGEELPEGGPIGPESVFAGLSENATTVAVDKSTGNVYVGVGCQATEGNEFKVEEYGPGGTKLAEFGSGFGAGNISIANHLAVEEASGTVYAADPGNFSVKVYEDESAKKTLATSVSGSEPGEVQCNMTGNACLPEYDEGQEVIVEATGENFEEWNGGTGSAEACNGSTETSCTFTLEADSAVNAAYGAGTPKQPLTARINQGSGTLVSNPAGIECSGAAITECSEEFEEGAEVTLTASPAAGYRLNTWNCASGAGTVNGRQCTVTMSEAREVRANFVPVYDLTVSKTEGSLPGLVAMNPPGDSCLYNCQTITQAYKTGAEVTLSANSYGHKHLVEFTGGTGAATACDATTECTVTIGTEDSSVEAVFGFDAKSTLSLEKAGGGTASIRAPSGFKCRSICLTASATYWQSPPEEVTVYWELEPGTSSLEWTSGAGTCTGTKTAVSGSCKVTMDEAHELVATLE